MKLFVWVNPYRVSYGTTMVFAVAETEEAARDQVRKGDAFVYGEYTDDAAPRSLDLGPPDRVVEAPCAEWHRWQE